MLTSTFQHLKGIGHKTERSLWNQGILTWEQHIASVPKQRTLFETASPDSILCESIKAYRDGDMEFFARSMPRSEFYRIALEFPQDVLFLDIETTGLSLYYDQITVVGWSLGKQYGVYINGHNDTMLRSVLSRAKVIVTFNGTMFDLKFIDKHFASPAIPPVHLDLRYFAKRVELSGGQKKIEKEIGFERQSEIEGMMGEAAPILWHKYRRGDQDAMRRLIEYNHADIEGMKWILDTCIERYFKKNDIPAAIQKKPSFIKLTSTINWAKRKPHSVTSPKVFIPQFTGSNKPLITYDQLDDIYSLNDFCAIGIDLVSSEDRETGFCVLKGRNATTCRVKTDEEMIRLALEAGADLISIDSPLSIPKGRTSFFDDSSCRDEFGIMRECERILHRRGISSYPCLIQSMQKLTRRGMLLAEKFRTLGIPVIESYPGAAQDIMAIPRKQAGLDYLVDGLKEFGITGEFTTTLVSHDELDAITSAIVGHFFWVGMYEGLGNTDEEYLIIPDLNADYRSWLSRKIIGVSGAVATGKTTAAEYLSSHGYYYVRYSQILQNILKEKGGEPTRSALQEIGWGIHEEKGQRWLGKKVISLVGNRKCAVIDGLRFPYDHALMLEIYGPSFMHIHITSELEEQKKRAVAREAEDVAFDQITKHPVEEKISLLEKLAHRTIVNNGMKKELFQKVDSFIGKDTQCR